MENHFGSEYAQLRSCRIDVAHILNKLEYTNYNAKNVQKYQSMNYDNEINLYRNNKESSGNSPYLHTLKHCNDIF
jgi:hypothetical protein